jgi:hypothetical protein
MEIFIDDAIGDGALFSKLVTQTGMAGRVHAEGTKDKGLDYILVSLRMGLNEEGLESQTIHVSEWKNQVCTVEKNYALRVFPVAELNRNMVALRALFLLHQILLESA